MNSDPTDEKGNPIVSAVVESTTCEWCCTEVPVRASGRRPRFCGPAHRLAMHRAVEGYRRALEEARRAQAEADAKVARARDLIRRGAGDWGTGLDSPWPERRLASIRFAPARNESPARATETPDEAATQPAWTYVAGKGWVDAATLGTP